MIKTRKLILYQLYDIYVIFVNGIMQYLIKFMSADQQLSQLNHLLEQIIKELFRKLQRMPEAQQKLPLALQQKMLKCEEPLQKARMIAYIVDTCIDFQDIIVDRNQNIKKQTRRIRQQEIVISEDYDTSPIGKFTENQGNQKQQYELLQKMLQKYEAQVRLHIRNEQTMKLHCDQLQEKIGILTKEKQQLLGPTTPGMRDTIQTTRSNRNKLKSNTSDQLQKNSTKNNKQDNGKRTSSSKKRNMSQTNRGNSKATIQNHGSKSDRQEYYKQKQREKLKKERQSLNHLGYPQSLNHKSSMQNTTYGTQKSGSKKTKNQALIGGSLNLQTMNATAHVVRSSRMNSLRANSQARKNSSKNQKQKFPKDKQLAKTLVGRKNY